MFRLIRFLFVFLLSFLLLSFFLYQCYDTSNSSIEFLSKRPVVFEGRLQPLDSVARNSFLFISGKQKPTDLSHNHLFYSLIKGDDQLDKTSLFLIRDPVVLDFLNIAVNPSKRYSFSSIQPKLHEIWEQADEASKIDSLQRNTYQKNITTLRMQIDQFLSLKHSFIFSQYKAQLVNIDSFQSLKAQAESLLDAVHTEITPLTDANIKMLNNYAAYLELFQLLNKQAILYPFPSFDSSDKNNPQTWLNSGAALASINIKKMPLITQYYNLIFEKKFNFNDPSYSLANYPLSFLQKARLVAEYYFNQSQLFYNGIIAYLLIFLLTLPLLTFKMPRFDYWLSKFSLLVFLIHGLGLLLRMFIQARPPVTNLYSSVVFVSWVAIFIFLYLDKFFKFRIGQLLAAILGFSSLIIAHQLSLSGDTLEQMRAVLDSNFWLTTHVILICIGYSAMYVAGFFASLFAFLGIFTRLITKQLWKTLHQTVFASVCIGLLFSVIGTLLGGIWGDQSWGRFWGWDPKENAAMLIVLWGAIILHANLAKMIKTKGLMSLAAFGNIIVTFSWFGVNMLGVGLHSYGFMEEGFIAILLFSIIQLYFVTIALLPDRYWKSKI